jgi:hypothetical protein
LDQIDHEIQVQITASNTLQEELQLAKQSSKNYQVKKFKGGQHQSKKKLNDALNILQNSYNKISILTWLIGDELNVQTNQDTQMRDYATNSHDLYLSLQNQTSFILIALTQCQFV